MFLELLTPTGFSLKAVNWSEASAGNHQGFSPGHFLFSMLFHFSGWNVADLRQRRRRKITPSNFGLMETAADLYLIAIGLPWSWERQKKKQLSSDSRFLFKIRTSPSATASIKIKAKEYVTVPKRTSRTCGTDPKWTYVGVNVYKIACDFLFNSLWDFSVISLELGMVNANYSNLKHSQLYSDSEQYKHPIWVTLFISKSDERSVFSFINTKNT